jgi:spore coat protein U-like protein
MYLRGSDPAGRRFKMKKFALVALFAVAAFGMAFAANPSGTVQFTGAVAESFSLTVPQAFTNGTISNDSETTWSLGDVKVISNVKNWTIALSSAHSGNLVLSSDNNETIAYTVKLEGLLSDVSLSGAQTSQAQARTAKAGNAYALSVKIPASSNFYQAGTYSDTITVTIIHP